MAKKLYEESSIQAIADAIREKNGKTTTYKPSEMAAAITAITTGGGGEELPEEAFLITGNCNYRFAYGGWNWFIKRYGNKITTKDIDDIGSMFYMNTELENIPFELNLKNNITSNMANIFYGCNKLKHIPNIYYTSINYYSDMSGIFKFCRELINIPYIYNAYPNGLSGLFESCFCLKEIPEDYFDTWNFSRVNNFSYASLGNIFQQCYSLRKLPMKLFNYLENNTVSSVYSTFYYRLAYQCSCLDEIVDLPVLIKTFTSNLFNDSFDNCYRLNRLTFKTNEDGSPKTANWKAQIIDLSDNLGWYNTQNSIAITQDNIEQWAISAHIINYNSGITIDKAVYNEATYQALKNDPDWFCIGSQLHETNYCRYNHDSAVETINSLPDTSAYLATAGGTNIIKFYGAAGLGTDGGAINTLTEEEIAVAAAKGWTVTLV